MAEHYHCPDGCEHPQPFRLEDGRFICGRCHAKYGEVVEMILYTSKTCGEDNEVWHS